MKGSEHRYPEINLSDMLWYIVSKWRIILIVSLLFAVLPSSIVAISSLSKLHNPSYMSSLQENNNSLTAEYEKTKSSLEEEYSLISNQLSGMEEYEHNSVLFKLDPRNLFAQESIYYLDFPGEPVSDAAPLNYSPFAEAYRALIFNSAADYLQTDSDFNYEENNVKNSILCVNVDDSRKLLEIRVIGGTFDEAQARMDRISETITNNYDLIRSTIGEHSVALLSSKSFKMISNELIDLRKSFETDYSAQSDKLRSVEKELDNLKAPVLSSLSRGSIVKSAIKYAIIGFILGFFALLLVFTVRFIGSGILFNVEELSAYPGERLGVIVGKPVVSKLDRLSAKHQGLDPNSGKDNQLQLVAANIRLFARENRRIALLGTAPVEKISECGAELLPLLPEFSLLALGSPLKDAETICSLTKADSAILIETIGKTKHSDLERELHILSSAKLPLIGYVLIDRRDT